MSFNDLERGVSPQQQQALSGPAPRAAQSPKEAQFLQLQSSLALQVFKINANVKGILKLVDQLGTSRDTGPVRKGLHDLTDTTRDMVKRGTDDLKQLALLQSSLPHQSALLKKTSHDFQLSLAAFQNAQKLSAERQRTVVQVVKQTAAAGEHDGVGAGGESSGAAGAPGSPRLQQTQLQIQALSPHELAHQEALIQERENEIREIETGIHELNEIFRDLGTIVHEQGTMVDNIESNISSVEVNTREADRELVTAHNYQRKAGKRAACLMLVVVAVVTIVLIAILN